VRSPPRFLSLQPPHVYPVDRIIDAIAVPVLVAALCAHRVEGGEATGVRVVVAPDKTCQAGVGGSVKRVGSSLMRQSLMAPMMKYASMDKP